QWRGHHVRRGPRIAGAAGSARRLSGRREALMATEKSATVIAQGAPSSLAVTVPAIVIILVLLGAVFLPDLVIQGSRGEFLLITLFLGGGAAWLSGRAIASTWRPYRQALLYSLLLACVVRFFHYALFEEELLSLGHFVVEALFLVAIAT